MPNFADAFSLAYSLHVVGTYFDGAAMLAQVGSLESEALTELCTSQLENLGQQGPATKWHIRRVERILTAADIATPVMPQSPDDYPSWVDAVTSTFYPLAETNVEASAGYSVGWFLGAFIENANLAAFALMLKDVDEDNQVIANHLAEVSEDLKTASDGFLSMLGGEGMDASVAALLNEMSLHIEKTPETNDGSQEPLDIADDFQEILFELGVAVEKLEGLLSQS